MEMEIFSYTDSLVKDAYGNFKKEYIYRETVPVDFQASSRRDKLTEAGEILQDTYKIYLDVNVTVNSNDIFKDEDGNTYTIIGTPIVNNRFKLTKHKKIEVQKTNKPIKVIRNETND